MEKKKKPHFRIMLSIIEIGQGQEMVYSTTLKEVSFPACRSITEAERHYKMVGEYYEKINKNAKYRRIASVHRKR